MQSTGHERGYKLLGGFFSDRPLRSTTFVLQKEDEGGTIGRLVLPPLLVLVALLINMVVPLEGQKLLEVLAIGHHFIRWGVIPTRHYLK